MNILLVDDHQIFLDGIVQILSETDKYRNIHTATNGREALEVLGNESVDVMVCDISMPVMSGIELLKEVKASHDSVKVIMLTMEDSGKTISELVRLGVDSYVLKNASKDELIDTIERVSKGEKVFDARVQRAILDEMVPGRKAAKLDEVKESLTEREKEILVLIAQEYTQQEIAEKLFISSSTVVYHKRKLMLLFEVKSIAGLTRIAMEMGLL